MDIDAFVAAHQGAWWRLQQLTEHARTITRVSPDELDELATVFNTLLEQLNATMQTALSSSLAHEKLRYQLLRAKINPHFLYNILESIKVCNTLGRIDDANLILSMLGSFYRLILR